MRTPEENKVYMKEYYRKNRERMRAQQAAYNEANREQLRGYHKEFYQQNKDKRRAGMAAFQAANPDYRKVYNDAYYAQNRAGFIQRARERDRHITKNATPAWADRKQIDAIYAEAEQISAETGIPHEVDHAVPLKHPLVCGLHVQFNLQVLTQEANRAKRNYFEVG